MSVGDEGDAEESERERIMQNGWNDGRSRGREEGHKEKGRQHCFSDKAIELLWCAEMFD